MSYLKSTEIFVFPSTRRASYQLSARQLSEARIAGLINQLIDKDGFIITKAEDVGRSNPFEFNIKGYYFMISPLSSLWEQFQSATNIYANLKLEDISGTDYVELVGQDDAHKEVPDGDDGLYYGVEFDVSPIAEDKSYSLHLFTRSGPSASWEVVPTSWVKFISSSVDIKIDGGKI